MKNDIHNISNELYTNRQQARIDKENKERKKKYNQDLRFYLQEEIDDFINEFDNGNINDIQLQVLNSQDTIIDYAASKIEKKNIYKATRLQIALDLKDIFLKEFNVVIKEYKLKHKLEKQKEKEDNQVVYDKIYDRLCYTFDYFNNQRQYDMKLLLNNMLNEDYIKDLFNELDLDYNKDNLDLFYKAYKTMKARKKETIKLQVIETRNNKIPLGWKTYGILKIIDKLIK